MCCLSLRRLLCAAALCAAVPLAAAADRSPAPNTPKAFASAVGGATPIGNGPLVAWRKGDQVLLSVPLPVLDRLLFWYVEAARFPPAAVAVQGNSVAEAVVSLERVGDRLLVRDRTSSYRKRSPSGVPTGEGPSIDPRRGDTPIDRAIDAAALGPVIAALPILAEAEGRLLVDLTATFSTDIDALTASHHIASAGLLPAPIGLTVDPARSFISDVDVYPDNLHIRSQVTFRAQDPADPLAGFRPVTIELGHSLILLPERPMAARSYDDRVGFIFVDFTEFETAGGRAATGPLQGVIKRFRLEKADPSRPVSDPVEPIVFHIGPGVPERWRPAIKAAVESWQPAFLEAGFSNAIIARDAPTPEEDPDWSPEDARYNVIRWVPQPYANAMGPSVSDPRSGEILFAHILLWPQVMDFFSRYYWISARGLDPAVRGLPLDQATQDRLLTYIVAHEVGHSIGLRHNHLASTAYRVAELRDPAFANRNGPNASIMAYGRINQAAQPGDGVTQLFPPGLGPYDRFVIRWGYGQFGATPAEEQSILDRLADEASRDRFTRWAAGEDGFEEAAMVDPRVLMENTGTERVEATRLGLRNVGASVAALPAATRDPEQLQATWQFALSRVDLLLGSVLKQVGGIVPAAERGAPAQPVPAIEQREAVAFLVGEGAAGYDALAQPEVLARCGAFGGERLVGTRRAQWVGQLLSGPVLARVRAQRALDPAAYGEAELLAAVTDAVWAELESGPAWRGAQRRAWLDAVALALDPKPDPQAAATAAALSAQRFSPGYVAIQLASAAESSLPAHARAVLPAIRERLRRSAGRTRDAALRLELLGFADRIDALLAR